MTCREQCKARSEHGVSSTNTALLSRRVELELDRSSHAGN